MTLASLGPYASFIVTSYLLVGLVVAGLVVWIRLDYQRQKQILRDLEARGVTRRSAQPPAHHHEQRQHTPLVGTFLACRTAADCLRWARRFVLVSTRLGRPGPHSLCPDRPPAPQTSLPPLEGLLANGTQVPGLDPAAFKGQISVVNVWASWCVPCHDEAPLLVKLAQDKRIRLIGINYKDSPDNARRFLGRYGNPFAAVGTDANGRASIEWGVYGVPETFVIGRDGTIAYKLIGPITPENIDRVLRAEIEKALGKP
jgi:cytochrome c biogenesis protein CcmG/thiol:disulfide interchange protein DsbE